MKITTSAAVLVLMGLSACSQSMDVTGRADNDMLRFSAKNLPIIATRQQ